MSMTVAVGIMLSAAGAHGAVSLTEEAGPDGPQYRLTNERVDLVVNPAKGAAVVSYKDRAGGNVELIHQAPYNGLCFDHFQEQVWPGELLDATYAASVVTQSADVVVLACTVTAQGAFRGTDFPRLRGLILEKTYTLRAGNPALKCRVKITAPPKESKLFSYWIQNIFFAGGTYERADDICYRPCVRGVRAKAAENFGYYGKEDFLKDFSAGWMALIDRKSKSGLACLFDYDEMETLYANAGNRTLEPMFRTKYLPPNASAEYVTWIVPVAGLDNVVAATPDFVAGYHMTSDHAGSGTIDFQAVRSLSSPGEVTFQVAVASGETPDQTVEAGTVSLGQLGAQPKAGQVTFSGAGVDPLVVRVQATVSTNTYAFEDYFNGAYKWGENITTDMQTPFYAAPRPKQQVRLVKPARLKLKTPSAWRVWYVEGLMDDLYNMTSAVRLTRRFTPDQDRRQRAYTEVQASFGMRLTEFPYDYEELLDYTVIILGGADKDALGVVGVEMLADFLRAGGGMIVLGGPEAYAKAGLQGSDLEELWPVSAVADPFDLSNLNGAPIEVATNAPFLVDLDWSAKPAVAYQHRVTVKPWATTILTAGGQPFLVVGQAPGCPGRVACVLGAPMGTLEEGTTPFWTWEDWPYLMRQVYWWVMRHDDFF
ncbi:MAG: hypothetical protein HQ523_11340 [Lentisphaerae bacterium]|nr:hypothetical protein [Lentisphaerota bacterium]